ncbi:I78 family peptidase inhibitor (plasmid) [Devosia sp. A8/3-2]|nr:I78 family peptidase inhibitor [Devosia sp. A8/3-2]
MRGTSASDATVGGVAVRSKGDVRVIAPGQAVIQNYSEDRLNLETDASGNLVRASCG